MESMLVRLIAFGTLLAVFGCAKEKGTYAAEPTLAKVETSKKYRVDDVSEGRMVIDVIEKGRFPVPIFLEGAYGVMLVNDGDEQIPKPRYVFANSKTRELLSTTDLAEFRKALNRLPSATKVDQYDSCSVSMSYGLSAETIEAFEKTLRQSGVSTSTSTRVTCYCESVG